MFDHPPAPYAPLPKQMPPYPDSRVQVDAHGVITFRDGS